jgi:hypothetical protein
MDSTTIPLKPFALVYVQMYICVYVCQRRVGSYGLLFPSFDDFVGHAIRFGVVIDVLRGS